MNEIVNSQVLLFLTSIEIGILMGCFFDLIRIFRKLIPHPSFFVQIEDMLFWVISGFCAFYMLYVCNYADIRPFIFLGMIAGAVLYFNTFSIIFMKVMTKLINWLKRVCYKLWCLILIPVKVVFRMVMRPIKYVEGQMIHLKKKWVVKQRKIRQVQYYQIADKKVNYYLKNKKN